MLIETDGRLRLHRRGLLGWMAEAGFRQSGSSTWSGPDSMVVGIK